MTDQKATRAHPPADLTRAESEAARVREDLLQSLFDCSSGHLSLGAWRRIKALVDKEVNRENGRG